MKLLLLLAAFTACALAIVPLHTVNPDEKIEGQYIVMFRDEIPDDLVSGHVNNLTKYWNPETNSILFTYNFGGLRGFAARMDLRSLAAELISPHLAYVQEDGLVEMYTYSDCTCESVDSQLWGLNRISYRGLQEASSNFLRAPASSGKGASVYVVDTGVYLTHTQFTGRIAEGYNAVTPGKPANDGNGHGTHVAGTIAGSTYGIAQSATIIPVKVLSDSGSGTIAQVVAGIDFVTNDFQKKATKTGVANLSLGGGKNTAINDAVARATDAGVIFVVAAGNDGSDACNYSPASAPSAITVAAIDSSDLMAYFSNYGACTDLSAPGVNIFSAWNTDAGATRIISGTSMASPHVAGIVALYIAENPGASPADVKAYLDTVASPINKSADFKGTPKKVGYIDCDPAPKC